MSGRRNPKWLGPMDVNTELLYAEDEHLRARALYACGHHDLAWEDADRDTRAAYLQQAGQEWIRDFARAPLRRSPAARKATPLHHFLDDHPIATYLTFMAVWMLIAVIVVLATGGAS